MAVPLMVGDLPKGVSVGWQPHPGPQTRFLSSSAYEVLYGGAKGGGKSDCLLYGALRQVANPNYRGLLLRATFPQLREMMDRADVLFERFGLIPLKTEKRWKHPTGGFVEFGFCETYAEAQQYTGQEFQYLGYDELGNLKEERTWLSLLSCVRSTDPTIIKMARASANPGGVGHGWIRRRFISVCPPDGTVVIPDKNKGLTRAFVQARVYDNPSIVENDPGYIEYLESLPEMMRRQLLDGDWEAGSSLAFEKLTETSHLRVVQKEPWHTYFGSFDWGFGHKWSFGLFANVGGVRVHMVDSTSGRMQGPSAIAERVRELLRLYGLTFADLQYTVSGYDQNTKDGAKSDQSGPTLREQFLSHGWALIKGDPARMAGFQNMLQYLESGLLSFAPTASNKRGIAMLRTLVVDPDSPNDVLKKNYDPTTGEDGDDFYDMAKMGLMSRPLSVGPPLPAHPQNTHRGLDRYLHKPDQRRFIGVPAIIGPGHDD